MKKYQETGVLVACLILVCLFLTCSVLVSKGVKFQFVSRCCHSVVKNIEKTTDHVKKSALSIIRSAGKKKTKGKREKQTTDKQGSLVINRGDRLSNHVTKSDMEGCRTGMLRIKLPSGVTQENVTVNKMLMEKKITIQFPKGVGEYDQTGNVAEAGGITGVEYKVSDTMITVTVQFGEMMDCFSEFDKQELLCHTFRPSQLSVPVIVIDPGHGGYDVGAIAGENYEKDIDLAVSLKLCELLEKDKIAVYCTRLSDTYPTVEQRADFANALMPDLFISIHANWFEDSQTEGISVLYNVKDDRPFNSARLSNILGEEIVKVCELENRGIVAGNDIHIVRHSAVPVALIEMGFMSNGHDLKILTSEAGQDRMALGIYNGIMKALTEKGK